MRPTQPLASPPGSLLVRLRARDGGWIERLPPVPAGWDVTVSVSDPRLRDVAPAALRRSGYRIVGVHPGPDAGPGTGAVDLLVTAAMATAEPDWWARVVALADRAFDLRLGPVQRVLGQEIALHSPT